MEYKFKRDNPDTNLRRKECRTILDQFPEKIPIICEKDPRSKIQEIDKTKFLVPKELSVTQFSYMIRKRLQIQKEEAFYLLVDGKHSITGDCLLNEIYNKYKDPDDEFLYVTYASELTWG